MREADSMLMDLRKSRNELLDYQKNIEQQLLQAEKTIIIAQKQDISEVDKPITEQDAVWHNYLLRIFIDIKNDLRIIDSAISQWENKLKGRDSLQEAEILEFAR